MNRQNLVLHPVEAVRTADLLDEILALPPTASYGQGHVANHGNGLVQNNVTYMYGTNEDENNLPSYPPPQDGWHKALTVGCTFMVWIGSITIASVLLGFIALIVVACIGGLR